LEAQRSYWKAQLGHALSALELPTDYSRPATRSFRGAHEALVLSGDLTTALTTLSQQENATLFMLLLAAFKTLLYRYTGQEDIVVGSPIANRTRHGIENLIGFFVNMLALRTDLSGNPSFRQLVARVREVCLEGYTYQDLPFEQVVEAVLPSRSTSRMPLFTVAFALQNAPLPPLDLPDVTAQPLAIDNGTTKYDLTLTVLETAEGLHAALEYDTDLFESTTIAGMLEHFHTLLHGIILDPDQRISDLPLISEAEQRLLEEWGNA
ncbi:MAG TPA: condensation domain-containing protein, partial [Herpetosiphonaceae bacterium]